MARKNRIVPYDKILQIIPNVKNTLALALINGEIVDLPIVCFGLRYILEDKGTEDEYEDYEVVGMTYFEVAETPEEGYGNARLIFVDEEENENYKFLGYTSRFE